MKKLNSKVKHKNKEYRIWAIKTLPVKDGKNDIIYCLTDEIKKLEINSKELK